MANKKLEAAKTNKNDEFYTQRDVIEAELKNYTRHFNGKTIYCNCDNPYESEFFKYFFQSFNFLALKRLIATCYSKSHATEIQASLFGDALLPPTFPAYKIDINSVPQDMDLSDKVAMKVFLDDNVTRLQGDEEYFAGDFRSKECVELLKEADIVVTNPPF